MPARIARSSVQIAAPKSARNKIRKRNLDAYAIASHSAPDTAGIKQNRLGEYLDDRPTHKRRRAVEDEEGEEESVEEDVPPYKRKRTADDEEDEQSMSDGEGNRFRIGAVAEDDDESDIDSEEAFGDSDEERFEGFSFRGSAGASLKRPMKNKPESSTQPIEEGDDDEINLDEAESELEEDEDNFGGEGVDLATMLDAEDEEMLGGKDNTMDDMGEESVSEGDEVESDSGSEQDAEDDDDLGADEERIARMRDRVEALDGDQQVAQSQPAQQPSALTVEDLLADLDPASRKQFQAAIKTRKKSDRPTTLSAPLPKRQQDRLDREVASKKAKEQLDRWRDTVIHNRRADFLSFPLRNPDEVEPAGKDKFVTHDAPNNELEQNIQRIMEESGMATKPGQHEDDDEEAALLRSEELATNKLPVEEVERRRAELRRTRELLFREEIKAKRIAKIKSKAYRRVHRKQKQREQELNAVGEIDDDERDRRRAEQRMGAKHKNSKWARALKETNRTVWDEGARDSVHEQARRNEELRRRIAGKSIDDEDGSGLPSDESDSIASGDGEDEQVLRQISRLNRRDNDKSAADGLNAMKFMRVADERRRAQNDEDVERLRKELAVEEGGAEEDEEGEEIEDQGLGRAVFGPQSKVQARALKQKKPELEEGDASEDEDEAAEDDVRIETEKPQTKTPKGILKKPGVASGPLARASQSADQNDNIDQKKPTGNAWLDSAPQNSKKNRRRSHAPNDVNGEYIDTLDAAVRLTVSKPAKQQAPASSENAGNTDGWTLVTYNNGEQDDVDSEAEREDLILTAQQKKSALQQRAFAGDDVEKPFNAEKTALAESEDEKEESTHMPGWGSWAGEGLSKSIRKANNKQRHNPLYKTKLPGVKAADRKDAKLENVIVRETSDRKGKKYKADLLPHEFERREQYERSLRVPVGPEWTTKETFQNSTRPRVVVKPGVAVTPMQRPLL